MTPHPEQLYWTAYALAHQRNQHLSHWPMNADGTFAAGAGEPHTPATLHAVCDREAAAVCATWRSGGGQ